MTRRYLTSLIIFMFTAGALAAHPHLWIDTTVDLQMDSRGLSGVAVTWLFDEFNSADMIFSFDENLDGEISTAEQERVRMEAFAHLAEIDYFLVVFRGQDPVELGEADSFNASILDGRLQYEFSVPVRVAWNDVENLVIASFDQSYFIDFISRPVRTSYARGRRTVQVRNETLQLSSEGWGTIRVPAVRADLR